jgi:AraC-like DNA-binding protein
VTAVPSEARHGDTIEAHSHPWVQLLYASGGVMRVRTELGVWIIPPRRALLIAPGVLHELTMLSDVNMRALYIDADAAGSLVDDCRVLEVSSLLRELILALALEPVDYPPDGRGADLALDAGASARTLIRLFPKETGLHYRQWVQQVHLAHAFEMLAHAGLCQPERFYEHVQEAAGPNAPALPGGMERKIGSRRPGEEWHRRICMRQRLAASDADYDKRINAQEVCALSIQNQLDFNSTRRILRRHSDSDSRLSVSGFSTSTSSPCFATRKLARRCTSCLRFSTKLSW